MLQQAGMCQCVQYGAQLYGAMLQQAGLCQPVQYHAELCSPSFQCLKSALPNDVAANMQGKDMVEVLWGITHDCIC